MAGPRRVQRALIIIDDSNGTVIVDCTTLGRTCLVPSRVRPDYLDYFVKPTSSAVKNDPTLDELTDQLNALINEVNSRRKDPESTLGLLTTPRGLMPVWKYEDAAKLPRISAGSKTYDMDEVADEEIEGVLWAE